MNILSEQQNYKTFNSEWKRIESVETYPHYLRNIITITADEFIDMVNNSSIKEIKKLVESIYSGDAYILKAVLTGAEADLIRKKVFDWSKQYEAGFQKMLDGCSNYHSFNKSPQGPKGGYVSLEHSHVFFRHNEDELQLFEKLDKYWNAVKILSGRHRDSFKSNIPSDGIIDRITLIQYPIGCGKITRHYDSPKSQKLLFGCLLTQIGQDYDLGKNGFYLVNKEDKNVYLENEGAGKGDAICVYPAMYHGVPSVTKKGVTGSPNWGASHGRWYLQCYSAQSHEVEHRDYSVGVKDPAGHGPVANYIGETNE